MKSKAVEYYVLGCLLGFNWPLKETVECVPNFSTSDPKVVNEIVAEIEKGPSTYLLDHSFDDYYNRLVVSARATCLAHYGRS